MPVKFCKWCKEKHEFCACCGIGIGFKHKEEHYATKVRDYTLCSQCYGNLVKSGRIEIETKWKGKRTFILYLNKDGSVMKKRLKKKS